MCSVGFWVNTEFSLAADLRALISEYSPLSFISDAAAKLLLSAWGAQETDNRQVLESQRTFFFCIINTMFI